MVLPTTEEDLLSLYKEIVSFLWTKQSMQNFSKKEISGKKAPVGQLWRGGLKIQHPGETAEGLRINLIQKYLRKLELGSHTKFAQMI
jgi:hypothetical protein